VLAVQRLGALGQALGEVVVGAMAGELPHPAGSDVAELGPDEAGLDEDDVDAEPPDLLAEGVGVGLQGVLGGVVPGAEGEGDLAAHGGDVDDRARALPAQVRQHELGQAGRAEQVDLELVAGLVEGDVLGGAVESEPGVVDQDVDPALPVEDRPHGPLQVGVLGHVHRQRVAAGVADGVQALDPAGAAVDGVAGAQQLQRGGAPDARRGAGDEDDLGHGGSLPSVSNWIVTP
jgi:hypothetical protein